MYPEDVVEAVFTSFRNNQNDKMDRFCFLYWDHFPGSWACEPWLQLSVSRFSPHLPTKACCVSHPSCSVSESVFLKDCGMLIHCSSFGPALPRTIVFIDINDFGRVVAGLHPVDLVLMLDRVFTQMDLVCQDRILGAGLEIVRYWVVLLGVLKIWENSEKNKCWTLLQWTCTISCSNCALNGHRHPQIRGIPEEVAGKTAHEVMQVLQECRGFPVWVDVFWGALVDNPQICFSSGIAVSMGKAAKPRALVQAL